MLLANSNYKINDIVTLKLSNGEELVGKLAERTDTEITLVRPLVFTMHPQNGQAMLVPWLMSINPLGTDPISINRSNILTITKTMKDIADSYIESTSGIVKAPPGLVL